MGIPGLTSYITNRSDTFLRDYELHGTNLIIDGCCLMFQLYKPRKLDWSYGGEYIEYSKRVNIFFDELKSCNVTPIVVFDGGIEDKKLKTIYRRYKQRIACISEGIHASDHQMILPLLATDVFKHVIRTRRIKSVMSLFEADDHIASLAKIFNCPVLSLDSDFFLYDVQYIPFNMVHSGISDHSAGSGYAKRCKIFKTEFFLESFPNMNRSILPLAAILLGNDYISCNVFKPFLCTLKVPRELKKNFSSQSQLKIQTIFKWLECHTLNSACAMIISKINREERQKVLKTIEMILTGYLNVLPTLLEPLGYTPEEINIMMMQGVSNKSFEFTKIEINIEEDSYETGDKDNDTDLSWDDINNLSLPEEETYNITKPGTENKNIISMIPSWFIDAYKAAKYPGYFMDILVRQLIVISDQMEDFSKPPSVNISLKIISVIFKLLSNGTTNATILKYIGRGQNNSIETFELNCDNVSLPCDIPSLAELKDFPRKKKRYIFDCTLGVSSDKLIPFPPEWGLYIAAVQYWLDEAEVSLTDLHVYSVVFLLVFHVIRKVLKYHSYFKKKIDPNNDAKPIDSDLESDEAIKYALCNITETDCKKAESYFDLRMCINKCLYDQGVIHNFSLFQNCIKSAIYLNTLLDAPYQRINIGDFHSGVLIHNIFMDLSRYMGLNKRVSFIFREAPSVLKLFIAISSKIKSMRKPR